MQGAQGGARKIIWVFLKHQCLSLQEGCVIKRLLHKQAPMLKRKTGLFLSAPLISTLYCTGSCGQILFDGQVIGHRNT